MGQTSIPGGLWFPTPVFPIGTANGAMDADEVQVAMIGQINWATGVGSSKTINTTGSSAIQCAITFYSVANAATVTRVGIQDVNAAAGPIAQPDGTAGDFDVYTDLNNTSSFGVGTWSSIPMTSGTKTMAHGDVIAVVFHMTGFGGTDFFYVRVQNDLALNAGQGFPVTNFKTSSGNWQTAYANSGGNLPNVVIVASDGTLGWINGTVPALVTGTDAFQDSDNPDERGMMFELPWDCEFDSYKVFGGITDNASGFTLKAYTDPLGTPTAISGTTVVVPPRSLGVVSANTVINQSLVARVALTKATPYAFTMLATGSSNCRLANYTLGDEALRVALPGGTTIKKVTRNGSTGAFSAESPATTMYAIGPRICSWNDSAGAGGSGARVIGC